MTEMFIVLALVLLLVPFAVLHAVDRLARAGKGPLADADRMIVFDGMIVPVGGHVVVLVDRAPAHKSDGTGYRDRMAELASADAVVRPLRLPPGSR